mgnify:CR=1 FL=1|tara:strand:+ start:15 stop:536 length:522 start_codon:yes stop_codon:yes gene_type:complete
MKTYINIYIIMGLLFMATTVKAQEESDEQKRDRVEKTTKPFNLNYFTASENSFYVLEANIIENKIVIDSTARLTVAPGKLPYPSGNFKVSVLDKQGKQIVEYLMQDPLLARSCEGENNHIDRVEKARVFIALPKNNSIATLVFSRGKEELGKVDIENLIIRTQREGNTNQKQE